MPFDSKPEGRLTLADLSWRLRNPGTWPLGFRWDYDNCNQCAMGLAWQLSGGKKNPFGELTFEQSLKLTMAALADAELKDHDAFREIFSRLHARKHIFSRMDITPYHVADAIDGYLALRETADAGDGCPAGER